MNSLIRTPAEQCETWITEILEKHGGAAWLTNVISELEKTKLLTEDDRQLQRGHEHESRFAYRCRWAVTNLRKRGILKAKSPRGMIELAEVATPPMANKSSLLVQEQQTPRVWIFQANPKIYRIFEALQQLDRVNFYVGRYVKEVTPGDVALMWAAGARAGIYAQGKIVEGVELRPKEASEKEFWVEPDADRQEVRPRVVIGLERRFLSNPLLRTTIQEIPELQDLEILRQPQGTNFKVTQSQWGALRRHLPEEETFLSSEKRLMRTKRQTRGGKIYEETCSQIMERYVREHFRPGEEHPRSEIVNWFANNFPRFKKITVQCHVEQCTTNYRSRVHYNAGPKDDLLFRIEGDWDRVRLYEPEADPPPIYKIESTEKRQRKPKIEASPTERHRHFLQHLAKFGELTPSDEYSLGVTPNDMHAWLDSLLVVRPGATVVSPLFLWAAENNPSPDHFTTRLAIKMIGDNLERALSHPIDSLEGYVWEHLGFWRLEQPHPGDGKWHGYLTAPTTDGPDRLPSEKLDLFAHLPPGVISDLVRDTGFLTEQQKWSAQAAAKGKLGPLSRQTKSGVRRPLFLSLFQLPEFGDEVEIQSLPEAEVVKRNYVIAGLPLCSSMEWAKGEKLPRAEIIERLLNHPLYAVIVQVEVYRIMASLSGETPAHLRLDQEGNSHLEVEGYKNILLWQACRSLLVDLGFWPVTLSANDSHWERAVYLALVNLENLNVLERIGEGLCLTEHFSSEIKAHPGHPQNRGEKEFRIRLGKYIESAMRE